jgi:5-methylcytosine-specific restriction endonuclease McrA
MRKQTKKCRGCKSDKPIEQFVDSTGSKNPRGSYCLVCYKEQEQQSNATAQAELQSTIRKLKILYGEYWQHYATPGDFRYILFQERTQCPYCGRALAVLDDTQSTVKRFLATGAHLDHMDPLAKGGEDSIRNVVFICNDCNIKKRDALFLEWLDMLEPEYKRLARALYIEKHRHAPEKFKPSEPTFRTKGVSADLLLSEEELLELYPKPIVDGPPET